MLSYLLPFPIGVRQLADIIERELGQLWIIKNVSFDLLISYLLVKA